MIDEKEIYFIVVAPPYTRISGGIYALHALAQDLYHLGCNVGVLTSKMKPGSRADHITLDTYHDMVAAQMTTIAIYPDIMTSNSLEADYAVWWLLNYPGFLANNWNGDYSWANRIPCFVEDLGKDCRCDSILTYPLYDPDYFFPKPEIKKNQIVYYEHRIRNHSNYAPPPLQVTKILTPHEYFSYHDLRELFWTTSLFVTSEWTGTAIIAQLCGVPILFLESPILTKNLHSGNHFDYGSTWIANDQGVKEAQATLHAVREKHKLIKANWICTLENEVKVWINESIKI